MNVVDSRRIPFLATCGLAALLLAAAPPAMARKASATPPASPALQASMASMPQQAAINAYYSRWQGPAWFGDGGRPATELASILRRAPLDGLANGPALAAEVEQATQAAATGNSADTAAAKRILSAAWVAYVEAIRQPTRNMIYGYASLAPKPGDVDQILTSAAGAKSLQQHLTVVSAVNPVYSELREAAWSQMRSSSGAAPDPRIVANLNRLRSLPVGGRFVLVNAATQRLQMYENGRSVDSMKVIVGTKELPTPMIASVIYYATFNPYWNVPDHLVRKTVAANVLRQGMGYLKSRGYQVMSDWSEKATVIPSSQIDWKAVAAGKTKIRVRQLPGPGNSMGRLKFSFANGEDIYLHDTPSKGLFAKSDRALSNGCIRLEDATRFGRWLLGREPVAPSSEPEQFVQLPHGVPVYVTYLTAQPAEGKISYAADIYDRDASFPKTGAVTGSASQSNRVSTN